MWTEAQQTICYSRFNNMTPNLCNLKCMFEVFACIVGNIGSYNSMVLLFKNMTLFEPSWVINVIRHLY